MFSFIHPSIHSFARSIVHLQNYNTISSGYNAMFRDILPTRFHYFFSKSENSTNLNKVRQKY